MQLKPYCYLLCSPKYVRTFFYGTSHFTTLPITCWLTFHSQYETVHSKVCMIFYYIFKYFFNLSWHSCPSSTSHSTHLLSSSNPLILFSLKIRAGLQGILVKQYKHRYNKTSTNPHFKAGPGNPRLLRGLYAVNQSRQWFMSVAEYHWEPFYWHSP